MQWNSSLSVGVDLIDTQHQELFRRIDSFYDAMKAGRGQDEVLKVLDFMLNSP
jgi:hemerythrin